MPKEQVMPKDDFTEWMVNETGDTYEAPLMTLYDVAEEPILGSDDL